MQAVDAVFELISGTSIFQEELIMRNFYSTDHAPYYIYGLDYLQQSAGIRALHYLCHALNESGLEAYITCDGVVPQLRTPVLTTTVMMQHHATGRKPIMVYPEIVSGDPLAAGGVVVRWLLNTPGHIGGDTTFPEQDLIFAYSQVFLPAGMSGHLLHIPTADLSVFNNDNNPDDATRDLVCFYAHKYLINGGTLTEHVHGAISLCKDQKLTHTEIAALLRRSRLLYVYEATALVVEALLCGCPVSIVETDYWRNHVVNFSCGTDSGVIMDDKPESIVRAKENVHNFRINYEETVLKTAWAQLDYFVKVTQDAAKMR
jgi:O-antigen biosynthesis protein